MKKISDLPEAPAESDFISLDASQNESGSVIPLALETLREYGLESNVLNFFELVVSGKVFAQ